MKKTKRGQSTLEYVIILAVVCAAIVAVGVLARPAAQGLLAPFTQVPQSPIK
jgi:uncharacterized membrane protein YphA (DoxX/SURF4 family)